MTQELKLPRILTPKEIFTDKEYTAAIQFAEQQLHNIWFPLEINLEKDLQDLHTKLTPSELNGVISVLKLFTTYELRVGNYWMSYVAKFFPRPEVIRMASVFSMTELSIHGPFYSRINDMLGLDTEEFYLSYKEDPILANRMDWLERRVKKHTTIIDKLKSVAVFSMIEGAILFSAFAFLKSFNTNGKNILGNLNTGIDFTVREECVIPTTKVLTENGWKEIQYITLDDSVAQFNNVTQEVSFTKPIRVIKKEFDGDLVRYSGTIAQTVTPNHRMLVRPSHSGLVGNPYKFKEASTFSYNGYSYCPISGFKNGDNSLSNLERFLIATQADGSVSKRYTGTRCGHRPITFSFSKQRKIDKLLNLVSELMQAYDISIVERAPTPKKGNRNSQRNFVVNIPLDLVDFNTIKSFEWVKLSDINSKWSEEFLDELAEWDGSRTSLDSDLILYSNTNYSCIEKVQAICALSGFRSNVLKDFVDDRSDKFNNCYRLSYRKSTEINGTNITKDSLYYNGYVYCLTVDTGAFIIKDNDKVSITGNCQHAEAGAYLFNTLKAEAYYDKLIDDSDIVKLNYDLRETAKLIFEHESIIVNKIFEQGSIEGITSTQLNNFVESRLDICLHNINVGALFRPSDNPIANWFYLNLNSSTLNDFFVTQGTDYKRNWNESKLSWKAND